MHILIFTPHAQREWGEVIDCGVHIYIILEKWFPFVRERAHS